MKWDKDLLLRVHQEYGVEKLGIKDVIQLEQQTVIDTMRIIS